MKDIETRQSRRDQFENIQRGMRGLSEGFDPHMLDVAEMVSKSWKEVSEECVARCWIKSKALPCAVEAELGAQFGRVSVVNESEDTKEIVDCMSRLSITLDRRDPFFEQIREVPTTVEVTRWFQIESDVEVSAAMTEDTLSDVERSSAVETTEESNFSSDSEEEELASVPIPSVQDILQNFQTLESIAVGNDIDGAIIHLRRARQLFLAAKRREGSGNRQLLISELLKPNDTSLQ